ncbi:hypothetical protein N0V93_009166 [Gnomoniopsis smithogilvyi]|uniref:Uncharacterized protein n=1 Tax=Gnomoniopsis smithogilvyi TaxID=1191159 RepID=A0A9W8YKC6_9PEZI|nr:hypothetical protein N0V93_009166 [Gnomoniopsis smithogilvyi]
MDAHGSRVRAEDPVGSNNNRRRNSTSSDVSLSSTGEESFATAQGSLQRQSSSSAGGSGLGISGYHSRRASAPRMGSVSTITAAAAAQGAENWTGGIMRQIDLRVESSDLDQLDAELRRRSRYLPRESRWTVAGEHEAIRELTSFLRNVTPPPSNIMSIPSPTTTTLSSMSSIRRRKSGTKSGTLMKVVRLFRRSSSSKKKKKKPSPRPASRSKKRPGSPSQLKRSHAQRGRRPPRIKLPDTAISGRTVDGHRHIAISIPIEHAHLGPEARYAFPSPMGRARSRSMSSADTPSPRIYDDVNYSIRPMTAFVTEPHIGTQLGPLVEERESLSSRSWEKGSSTGSGHGEAAIARKVRLASRNTFGTVHEELSRPNTSSGMLPHASSPHMSDESGEPTTPSRASDEIRARARRQTLAALAGGGPPTRPASGSAGQRPLSAHSFGSFATSSPSRVYYPSRKSSLHPSGAGVEIRRPRTMSNTTGGTNYSRDSSRDQTLQESIFSERSYLESLDTVDTGNVKEELHHSPVLVSEATFARRFEGSDVLEFEPRSSVDSQRRKSSEKRQSGSSHFSASSREKRSSGSPRSSAVARGKQRESYEGPVIVRPKRHSSGSTSSGKQRQIVDGPITVRPEKRHSGGPTASASAILGKGELAPVVITRESAVAVASGAQQKAIETQEQSTLTTPTTARRSKFVEDLVEAPRPDITSDSNRVRQVQDQQHAPADLKVTVQREEEAEDREGEPPSIEVQQATPTEVKTGHDNNDSPSRRRRTSQRGMVEADLRSSEAGPLAVPLERSRSRETRRDKGKQREASLVQSVEEVERPSTPDGQSTEAKNTSPIPSPKERRDRRKSILLSRKERVAELRAALERPGAQPSDLVMERKLSNASSSSSGSTVRTARLNKKRDSFPYAPSTLSPIVQRTTFRDLSFTGVLTVADVQPSSPRQTELVRKVSNAMSVSSPATVTTFVKTSPIPPYQSIGSVTPPDSPADSFPEQSPTSQFFPIDTQGTPLRHPPPSPTKGRITRRRSGRTSPSFSSGRRSPAIAPDNSPPRPKTAGKGAIASKKPFFEASPAHSSLEQGDDNAGRSKWQGKSILNMSRSEIFDRYEALRERQTRDMERRIRRLERHGDYWLTSMMPILNDMSQALKSAVDNFEHIDQRKGKEVDRDPTLTRYDDVRQSRFDSREMGAEPSSSGRRARERTVPIHSEDSFDPGEFVVRRSPPSSRRRSEIPQGRPRLYLHDDATLGRGRDHLRTRSSTSEGRSFSMNHVGRDRSPVASLTADPQPYSGSTTMVDNFSTARGNLSARPSSKRASSSANIQEDLFIEADRLARLEKISERIDTEIRRFPLVPKSPSSTRKSLGSRDGSYTGPTRLNLSEGSEESLRTYQGTDIDMSLLEDHWSRQRGGNGSFRRARADSFDTIEPLMRELQFTGSRVSLESPRTEDLGDNEVRKMKEGPGPRAVVGFGAFSM